MVDKPVGLLTRTELAQAKKLTFGGGGSMRARLEYDLDQSPDDTRAITLIDEQGVMISWALLFFDYSDCLCAYFYTKEDERRKGFGRQIANHLAKSYQDVQVCPWDERSGRFFANMEFEAARGYEHTMQRYKPPPVT